jgi:alpha-tubulin suppressor-like RCC1 family protein
MATTGFTVNGVDVAASWPDKTYLFDNYPDLISTYKTAGLWNWGQNVNYGQLGDNTNIDRYSPVQTIAGGTNWKQIAGGIWSSAGIKTDGTLWTWGSGYQGQLGDNTTTGKSSPVQTIAGGTNWKQVAGGFYWFAAIKNDGTLWTWGYNNKGQLGDNSNTARSSPIQTASAGTTWKFVAACQYILAAIKTDGSLWLCGENSYGTLGNNAGGLGVSNSSLNQTVSATNDWQLVAIGGTHVAAIKTDGTLWSWGQNNQGALGDNTITHRSSPVQTVSGGTNWKQVACGGNFTSAIKNDGTLWTWGYNLYGMLGDGTGGTGTNKSSPIQTIAGGTNWKLVSGTFNGTVAIKTDGTLWNWGRNNFGQLGVNDAVPRSSPVQTVAGGTNWKLIGNSAYTTIAIRDDSSDPI